LRAKNWCRSKSRVRNRERKELPGVIENIAEKSITH